MPLPAWLSAVSGRRWVVGVFFGLLALLGLALHGDYGVSWDETNNHLNGLVNLKYISSLLPAGSLLRYHPTFATTPNIREFPDAHHGPVFEISAVILSYLFTDHDPRSYFLLRHLLIFSLFLVGAWAVYRLGTSWLRDWRWGLLTAALLILSPRFFAEAFYNGKDIVYMAFFTLAMYTLTRLMQQPTAGRVLVHGLATALAIAVRVQGAQLLIFTALGLVLSAKQAEGRWQLARGYVIYLLVVLLGVFSVWPYLWAHTVPELLDVSTHAVRYPWPFTNLYMGQFLSVGQLPWHYVPVWMAITIPLPYSLSAALGLLVALKHCRIRGSLTQLTESGSIAVLVALWLLAPLLVVMLTHTVVYEGWRHLYFIYPALLLWAVQGFRQLLHWSREPGLRLAARLALGLALLETGHTAWQIVQLHPYQNVYFSFLPAAKAERLFERDYWGLAYRQGLEWMLAHDPAPVVTMRALWHYPLYNNSLILKPEQRARLRYTPDSTARYYLTGYRWHPQPYLDSLGSEVFTIRAANGIKVLSVFRQPGR
ncbi:hypothetical protein [Hymenobacter wooponensis]|uniref:Uncharacterized protein n=1 Tax=Hymenobacter wooponensis TaxID=1525360 RepID=A0A4Z0MGH3_9BACT|nr:hypothetical protein [Hymenobacter wooponensis]TGD78579.1 hypothetical protein EU557_20995 [Hymenobacter wooponensis]